LEKKTPNEDNQVKTNSIFEIFQMNNSLQYKDLTDCDQREWNEVSLNVFVPNEDRVVSKTDQREVPLLREWKHIHSYNPQFGREDLQGP
jgi:hypothetical protein